MATNLQWRDLLVQYFGSDVSLKEIDPDAAEADLLELVRGILYFQQSQGTTTDAAATLPTDNASIIALLKGLLAEAQSGIQSTDPELATSSAPLISSQLSDQGYIHNFSLFPRHSEYPTIVNKYAYKYAPYRNNNSNELWVIQNKSTVPIYLHPIPNGLTAIDKTVYESEPWDASNLPPWVSGYNEYIVNPGDSSILPYRTSTVDMSGYFQADGVTPGDTVSEGVDYYVFVKELGDFNYTFHFYDNSDESIITLLKELLAEAQSDRSADYNAVSESILQPLIAQGYLFSDVEKLNSSFASVEGATRYGLSSSSYHNTDNRSILVVHNLSNTVIYFDPIPNGLNAGDLLQGTIPLAGSRIDVHPGMMAILPYLTSTADMSGYTDYYGDPGESSSTGVYYWPWTYSDLSNIEGDLIYYYYRNNRHDIDVPPAIYTGSLTTAEATLVALIASFDKCAIAVAATGADIEFAVEGNLESGGTFYNIAAEEATYTQTGGTGGIYERSDLSSFYSIRVRRITGGAGTLDAKISLGE